MSIPSPDRREQADTLHRHASPRPTNGTIEKMTIKQEGAADPKGEDLTADVAKFHARLSQLSAQLTKEGRPAK